MTCMNQNHWNRYDPNCALCVDELRQAVRHGMMPEDRFSAWKSGKEAIGISEEDRILAK